MNKNSYLKFNLNTHKSYHFVVLGKKTKPKEIIFKCFRALRIQNILSLPRLLTSVV